MEVSLKGGNTGHVADVNAEKRLLASAVTSTESDRNCDKGNKFNVNTGDITITDATKLTLMYIKNSSEFPLFVTGIIYNLGNTTSGTGDVVLDVVRNPTSGSITTNENDCEMISNQNHGSNRPFDGLAYKGAQGETVISAPTNSKSISTRLASNTGRTYIPLGALVIPRGSSMAVNYTPPTSNTSQIVQVAVTCFFQDIVV